MNPKRKIQILGEIGTDITTDGKRMTLISSDRISIDPKLGLEASYKNSIFLRAGISNIYQVKINNDTLNLKDYWIYQPAIGIGFKINQLNIDYAFTSLNMQDNPLFTHVISLKLNFNRKTKSEDKQPKLPEEKPSINQPIQINK